ncbi:MAG: HU family DNA-binding protein [Planctomycetota bacterium]|nr:HU family DNA-binding protein [Planctomycetota bacterium]
MTKKEMIRRIAAELDINQVLAGKIVQSTLDTILDTLAATGKVELRNFGVFKVKRRAPRKARNPKTNEEVPVPAKSVICFQPGKNVAAMIASRQPVTTGNKNREMRF